MTTQETVTSNEAEQPPQPETPAVGVGVNDRRPNFRTNDGKLYLMRCFACEPEYGRENYCMCVADGVCAWCGWSGAEKQPG